MSPSGKSILRLAIIGTGIAYLTGDIFILHGPIHRVIEGYRSPNPKIAARVSGQPITRSQVDRAVGEELWLQGKSAANLTPAELETARKAALDGLIDHMLLRLQVRTDSQQIPVTEVEINERLPADFGAPVFSLDEDKPTILRSRPGWHLVEVTGRKPVEPRTFEQAKSEIPAAH